MARRLVEPPGHLYFEKAKPSGGGELARSRFEDAGVKINIGFSGCRGHERHIVEGCEQYATIEGVEMHKTLELEVGCSGSLAASAGRKRTEKIFGAAAKSRDVPGETRGCDCLRYAIRESLGERNHVREGLGREDVLQGSVHGGE